MVDGLSGEEATPGGPQPNLAYMEGGSIISYMLARRLAARLNQLLRHSPAVVLLVHASPERRRADLNSKRRFVVYLGTETFPLDIATYATGVVALAKLLQSAAG